MAYQKAALLLSSGKEST